MLKKIELIIFSLLLLALPFERALTFEFMGFTMKPPYFLAIALLVIFLWQIIFLEKKVRLQKEEIFLYAFVLWSFATVFWSIEQRHTVIVSSMFLFMAFLYSTVKRLNLNFTHQEKYLQIFIWLGLAVSIIAIYQFFGDMLGLPQKYTLLSDLYTKDLFGFPRVQSTFFEPGFLANFLLIPIFLNIRAIIHAKNKMHFLSLFVIGLAFFLTLSRGGIFTLVVGLVTFSLGFIFSGGKEKPIQFLRYFVTILSSLVFAVLLIFLFARSEGAKNYLSQVINTEDAREVNHEYIQLAARSYTVRIALQEWRKNPLFGVGTGAFGALPEFATIREQGNTRQTVNSLYPEVLVEEGLIGLGLFIAFLLSALISLRRRLKMNYLLYLTFSCIIFAIFLQYISFSTLYLVYVWVFLGLAMSSNHNDKVLKSS
ncbi:MAG: O-antigen ligase family protein [Patescibacteria group bacterium]